MEWTKIPTDLLQSRTPDNEIVAIVKYQMLWAMLEREPTKEICLRYMTANQYQKACQYYSSIQYRVNNDIKSVESHRKRQKLFYHKNQVLTKKPDGQSDSKSDSQSNAQSASTDKIRLDKIRNIPPTSKDVVPQGELIPVEKKITRFVKPSLSEVVSYCRERNNGVDPVKWYNYYLANGWRVGRNPMKDWRATVRTWERTYTGHIQQQNQGPISKSAQIAQKNLAHLRELMELEDIDYANEQNNV